MQYSILSIALSIFLSFLPVVSSAILRSHRNSISIPLRHINAPMNSPVLHSSVIHQQHVNRGVTRQALMSGRTPPSDYHLLYQISERIGRLPEVSQARYNRNAITEYLLNMQNTSTAVTSNGDPGDLNDGLAVSHTPNFPHSIGLDIQARDVGYIGTIQIGTPPCDYHLLMDSGSADLWVGGEGCQSDAGPGGCGTHKLLGPASSSTFQGTAKPWYIYYGSGNVSGTIVQDKVTIAGLSLNQLLFGVVYHESMEFGDLPFDGIMGLAQSIISQQNTPTIVESLRRQGLIKEAIVSYKIPRRADFKYDGEMTIGALDPAKYNHRSLVTVKNVNRIGFWETPITSVEIGGKAIPGLENRTGILDTGTTLIIAPKEDVEAIHGSIPGAYFEGYTWIIPCTTNVTISLRIKNRDFCIDPRDLAFLPVDVDKPDGDCFSGITSGNIGPFDLPTQWLVGDVFLKNVYFSTNEDNNEISIAKTV